MQFVLFGRLLAWVSNKASRSAFQKLRWRMQVLGSSLHVVVVVACCCRCQVNMREVRGRVSVRKGKFNHVF